MFRDNLAKVLEPTTRIKEEKYKFLICMFKNIRPSWKHT